MGRTLARPAHVARVWQEIAAGAMHQAKYMARMQER